MEVCNWFTTMQFAFWIISESAQQQSNKNSMHLSGLLCTWKTLQLHLTVLTTILLLAMYKKIKEGEKSSWSAAAYSCKLHQMSYLHNQNSKNPNQLPILCNLPMLVVHEPCKYIAELYNHAGVCDAANQAGLRQLRCFSGASCKSHTN